MIVFLKTKNTLHSNTITYFSVKEQKRKDSSTFLMIIVLSSYLWCLISNKMPLHAKIIIMCLYFWDSVRIFCRFLTSGVTMFFHPILERILIQRGNISSNKDTTRKI